MGHSTEKRSDPNSSIAGSKRQRLHTSDESSSIETSNKYASLQNMDAEEFIESSRKAVKQPANKKPPPIIMELAAESDARRDSINKIKSLKTKAPVYLRSMRDKIMILSDNKEDYIKICENLKSESRNYYTYTVQEDRPKIVVLRGIDASVIPSEIIDDLEKQGYKPTQVINMKTRAMTPSNCFQVYFSRTTDIKLLMQTVRYICSYKVIWDHFVKRQRGTQCHRCQRHGHAARNCQMNYRCVKCLDKHLPGECKKKDKVEKAKCVNCGEDHPANYKNCKSRINFYNNRNNRSSSNYNSGSLASRPNPPILKARTPPAPVRTGVSYSDTLNFPSLPRQNVDYRSYLRAEPTAAPNPSPKPKQASFDFGFIANEVQNLFGTDLGTLMQTLRSFAPAYLSTSCPQEKKFLLIDLLCKFVEK